MGHTPPGEKGLLEGHCWWLPPLWVAGTALVGPQRGHPREERPQTRTVGGFRQPFPPTLPVTPTERLTGPASALPRTRSDAQRPSGPLEAFRESGILNVASLALRMPLKGGGSHGSQAAPPGEGNTSGHLPRKATSLGDQDSACLEASSGGPPVSIVPTRGRGGACVVASALRVSPCAQSLVSWALEAGHSAPQGQKEPVSHQAPPVSLDCDHLMPSFCPGFAF